MIIYVLETVRSNEKTGIDGIFSIESIGVYSSEAKALEAIKELPPEGDDFVYNIQDFELDSSANNFMDEVELELKAMMDLGVVDQLVGEDGKFYYELTDAGEEIADNLSEKQEDEDEDKGW